METWAKGFHDLDHTHSLVSFANIYANVQTYRPEHVYLYNTMGVDFLCVSMRTFLLFYYNYILYGSPLGLFDDDDMIICYSSSSTPSYIACHAPPITELIFCHRAKISL